MQFDCQGLLDLPFPHYVVCPVKVLGRPFVAALAVGRLNQKNFYVAEALVPLQELADFKPVHFGESHVDYRRRRVLALYLHERIDPVLRSHYLEVLFLEEPAHRGAESVFRMGDENSPSAPSGGRSGIRGRCGDCRALDHPLPYGEKVLASGAAKADPRGLYLRLVNSELRPARGARNDHFNPRLENSRCRANRPSGIMTKVSPHEPVYRPCRDCHCPELPQAGIGLPLPLEPWPG